MPQAAIPIAAEAAVATTLTAAEIAAAQAAAAQLAAAELAAAQAAAAQAAAAQAAAATNSSVLSTIAATPVSSAAGATTAAGTGAGAGGAGGISSLVNTTGGPTTFEQVFSQGQNIAEGSTELGKLASTASELPMGPPNPYLPQPSPGYQLPPEPLNEINLARELPPITQPLEAAQTSAFNTTPTLTQYGAGAPPIEPPVIEAAFTHPNPEQVERLRLLGEADAGPLEKLLPPSPPPAPPTGPPNPDVLSSAEQARYDQLFKSNYSTNPFGTEPPAFDTLGFDSVDYAKAQGYKTGVDPSTIVTSPSGGTPLTGIDMLAKEIGATSAFNTAPTLTQYGAGAPVSTPLTSALPGPMSGPPTTPGLTGLQTNLSGMGSNMPPAPPFANQTMVPSTPVVPPEAPIYEAPTLSFPPGGAPPQVPYDPTAPFASYPGSTPPAQPLYPRVVTPQVNPAASAMNNASGATSRITEAMQNPMTNSPDLGPAQSSMNYPPGPDRLPVQNPATPDLSPPTNATPGGEQMRNVNGGQPAPYEWAQSGVPGNANLIPAAATPAATPEAGGLQSLFNQGLDYAKKNPLTTLMGANMAYNYLNPVKPYEKEKYKPTFKPGLYTGYQPVQPTPYTPQYAHGGLADLGGYSDGGRMLKGPGDGMSDDIPATIANKQPARLANEEFVIPADVVSHLGNGSSEAGAKVLYKMMDRVRRARTGSKKQGKQINPEKYLA